MRTPSLSLVLVALMLASCGSPPIPPGPATPQSVGLQPGVDFPTAGLTRCSTSGDRTASGGLSQWGNLAALGVIGAWAELWEPVGTDCPPTDTSQFFSQVMMFSDAAHAAALVRPRISSCNAPLSCVRLPVGADGGQVVMADNPGGLVAYEALWWKKQFVVKFYSQQFSLDQDNQISQHMADRIH